MKNRVEGNMRDLLLAKMEPIEPAAEQFDEANVSSMAKEGEREETTTAEFLTVFCCFSPLFANAKIRRIGEMPEADEDSGMGNEFMRVNLQIF